MLAAVFLSSCTRRHKPYTEIGPTEDLRVPLTDSGHSRSGSLRHARGQGVPIDRPSGMNSLIVCNSYSNRAGAWSRASYSGRYSHSYGSIETKRYLEMTTWWPLLSDGVKNLGQGCARQYCRVSRTYSCTWKYSNINQACCRRYFHVLSVMIVITSSLKRKYRRFYNFSFFQLLF